MMAARDSLLVIAGIALGIVLAVVLISGLNVLSPGTGVLPVPGISWNEDAMPLSEGITQLFSTEDIRSFITNHTDKKEETGAGLIPLSVPTTPLSLPGPGVRMWRYEVDAAAFHPDEYIVSVSSITHDIRATALFNILAGSPGQVATQQVIRVPLGQESQDEGLFILIDPIGDRYVGENFWITGTTNLPAGDDEMLVEVVTSSFGPTQKTQSGEFSGSTGTIRSSGSGSGGGGAGGGGGAFSAPVSTPVPTPVATLAPTIVPSERDYSLTNIQVQGVDEADIVKTDGTNIYIVSGNALHIVDAYPAETAKVLSTTGFSGRPFALYVFGDTIALICRDNRVPEYWGCEPGRYTESILNGARTIIYIFSVRDPSSPTLEREVGIDGKYTDSRLIGTWLYFLTSTPVSGSSGDIRFPEIRDGEKGSFTPAAYSIEGKDRAFAFTTIGSVDLDSSAAVRAKSFLVGTAGTVYVSPTHLYFGVHSSGNPPLLRHVDDKGHEVGGNTDLTEIYSFALKDGAIGFDAHGTVDGKLLNQYAMDEYEGNLRLATTVTDPGSWQSATSSAVTVLDGRLTTIGHVGGIAPGERIYATRFMGERLYMVTFFETDPFFVVDLTNPRNPSLVGTLKLPGFSNYLHPYDTSHIIGVGKTSAGGSVKVSFFDVSDISHPGLVDSIEIGGSGSSSEVLNDPKAFLFDKEKDILVLPIHRRDIYQATDGHGAPITLRIWGGAYVFSIDPSRGFSLKGTVKHYDERSPDQSQVKRALYIEDTLYTISPSAIFMSDLSRDVLFLNKITFG